MSKDKTRKIKLKNRNVEEKIQVNLGSPNYRYPRYEIRIKKLFF